MFVVVVVVVIGRRSKGDVGLASHGSVSCLSLRHPKCKFPQQSQSVSLDECWGSRQETATFAGFGYATVAYDCGIPRKAAAGSLAVTDAA